MKGKAGSSGVVKWEMKTRAAAKKEEEAHVAPKDEKKPVFADIKKEKLVEEPKKSLKRARENHEDVTEVAAKKHKEVRQEDGSEGGYETAPENTA